jgi:polyphosphate kinase
MRRSTTRRLYFNKELGWVDFNWRVLALAMDERTPFLERVKFVAIAASNLDEFVQKRIGGLQATGGGRCAPALRRRAHTCRAVALATLQATVQIHQPHDGALGE